MHCSDVVILHIEQLLELKQSYCENLELVPAVFASYLEIFICHLAAAVTLPETDNISPVCRCIC